MFLAIMFDAERIIGGVCTTEDWKEKEAYKIISSSKATIYYLQNFLEAGSSFYEDKKMGYNIILKMNKRPL